MYSFKWRSLSILYFLSSLPTSLLKECMNSPAIYDYQIIHCPEGWIRYEEEKCFKLYTTSESHDGAQKLCLKENSNLASVHSEEENKFLTAYILREMSDEELWSVWIGGIKRQNIWMWLDLSLFNYTNWWPNTTRTDKKCMRLATSAADLNCCPNDFGKMVTTECGLKKNGFICQKYQMDTQVRRVVHKALNVTQ